VKRTPGPRRYYVVSPAGRLRWRVYMEGRSGSKHFWLKSRATQYARMQALAMWMDAGRKSGVRVKNRKGVLIDEWSYGLDPLDVPG
jgi:hypothetical protein